MTARARTWTLPVLNDGRAFLASRVRCALAGYLADAFVLRMGACVRFSLAFLLFVAINLVSLTAINGD